ncbi:MAG: hypothetical protein MJY59_05320 [Bacteroidaceae bacterium]|nr:hypothetical protein [Bacteroidaceae bacterium]
MKKQSLLLIALLCVSSYTSVNAQRMQQSLGRGVVAVQNGSNVTVTWRRLAQEPEDAAWNIYVRKSGKSDFTKVNATPLMNTNYRTTVTTIPFGSEVSVAMVSGTGDDTREHAMSKPFFFKNQSQRNIYMEIRYDKSPLTKSKFTTKFVWPCDLDGDGEMDYVVDRCPVDGSRNHYIEGYLADGTFLWNIDLGVNEKPCDGQNDNLCAYDIDCDGFGELIVQTSDGTRLWDKDTGTWGRYLMGRQTGDTDGDGIIDYDTQSTRNPPRYMTVVDGMTGAEKASAEFTYDEAYNRTNKAMLMGEEYNKHEGHVGIFYYDGIHPGIVGEFHSRSADGKTHFYRNVAFAYVGGQWQLLFSKKTGGVVFHQIRIADVDGDGCDEMLSGEYAMDQDGSTLYNARISHGDRHRVSDIDPERPGMECFAIQQDAGDMLGQILYDAGTGEPIKKWYLPSVGDVGRGECMDVDRTHLGWEMWSTMEGVYDAKGDRIEGLSATYPTEGMWWDGELDREILQTSDSHYNFYFQDFGGGRLVEPAKESGYQLKTSYGKRGKFWGDIIGDWREELIVIREINGVCEGIVGLTTDYTTTVNNIYCLQQDPHYRGDCTTRGYYQTPNPGFYLGYDMPRPQLPPCMVADDETDVFGIADGNTVIKPRKGVRNVYAMPVKGQTLTLDGLDGESQLWKSQPGTLVLNGDNTSTANTIVSEGSLALNGDITGTLDLRARGTLTGTGTVADIILEGALNYEGCRIMPTSTITFANDLNIKRTTYMEINTDNAAKVCVRGNLSVTAPLVFTIVADDIQGGEYTLIEFGGSFSGAESKLSVRGLTGQHYSIRRVTSEETDGGRIVLVIHDQREASGNVFWTGAKSRVWDYQTENFSLDDQETGFVAGDSVVFGDEAQQTNITVDELIPIGSATFINDTKSYTLSGRGGLSGTGDLIVNGTGRLTLNAVKSDYTGKTIINSGTVTVKELADAGVPSSIGAASASAANLQLGQATLIVSNANTATNRGVTLNDTATLQIASGVTSLKGQVKGNGTLLKTGNGQLNITYAGANSWGKTILQAGILAMGAWNTTIGKPTSSIHVTGNSTFTVFNCNSTSTIPTIQNTIEIDEGKTLTFHAGQRCAIKGTLKGKGTFKIDFPYVRGDVSTNTSAFEGVYEVTTSNCRFVQGMDLSKATLKLDADSYAAGFKAGNGSEASYVHKIGTLTGSGTLGSGTWQISRLLVNYKTTRTSVSCDAVTINGPSTLRDLTIDMRTTSTVAIPDGAEFVVLKGSGRRTVSGAVTMIPESPKEGYAWDTSRLSSEGVICVKAVETDIESLTARSTRDDAIYDLRGTKVSSASPRPGVYIINGRKVLVK